MTAALARGRWQRIVVFGAAMALGPMAACQESSSSGPQTLVVGWPADALQLDPALAVDGESVEVDAALYETLVTFRAGGGLEPGLAESWEVDADGKTWRFRLKPRVKFHDGSPLLASDVAWAFERQRNPNHPDFNPEARGFRELFGNLVAVVALDDRTVEFSLERPYAAFGQNLAAAGAMVAKRVEVDGQSKWLGTGPFVLAHWEPGQTLELRRFEGYHGAPPRFDRLLFRVIPDSAERLIALETGAIDLAKAIAPAELQFVRMHPNLQLYESPPIALTYLALNLERVPDWRVRQAIRLAIHKTALVEYSYQGLAVVAEGALPEGHWAYHRTRARDAYLPESSAALVAEVRGELGGEPLGTLQLWAPTSQRDELFDAETMARMLASQLTHVGLPVEVQLRPRDLHLAAAMRGEQALSIMTWLGDISEPSTMLRTLFDRDHAVVGRATNTSFYLDAEVHGILTLAAEVRDGRERERLYSRVLERVSTDVPWVPLAYSRIAVCARAELRGLELTPRGQLLYAAMYREAP